MNCTYISTRATKSLAISALFLFSLSSLAAEEPSASDRHGMSAQDVLIRLHSANLDDVSMGQLAKKRGSKASLKQIGDKLIRDHNTADKELLSLAKSKGIDLSTTSKGMTEKVRTLKEGVQYQNLKTLSGAKFDTSFLAAVRSDHEKLIEMLESTQIDDPEINNYAKRQLASLKAHLASLNAVDTK